VSSPDAACRIVAAGLGLSILLVEAIEPHAIASALTLLPLAEPWARRRFVICSRPEGLLSATTRLLIDHLRQQALETDATEHV
jgi:DNA-binding transcriptional LysR family regulator